MRCGRAVAGLLCSMLLAPGAAATVHEYRVRPAADLATLAVRACPAAPGGVLVADDAEAPAVLRRARAEPGGRSLAPRGGRLTLVADERCVDYEVDLAAAAALNPRYAALDEHNRALAVALWLWLPAGGGEAVLEVGFELPQGMAVSVPWQPIAGAGTRTPRFRVPPSPRSDAAVSAFGRFAHCSIGLPGTTLRAAILGGHTAGRPRELAAWLAAAAGNVNRVYGRFPHPAPQVLVVPVARGRVDRGEPVPFGHVIRDGGEAVQFYVNQRRALADFTADWTATHEFAHLLIPYVDADEKWLSEGLASYYQNVLMARGGAYTEQRAWRKLIEGFRRGERSVPHLSIEAAMPVGGWDGLMKTYWGGAVLALMADVTLREHSDNRASLDSVLDALQACCLPAAAGWSGRRLVRELDRLAPFALFEALYDRYRGARGFPDFAPLMARLGVALTDTGVRFDEGAELANVRRAIMADAAPAPAVTVDCAADGDAR